MARVRELSAASQAFPHQEFQLLLEGSPNVSLMDLNRVVQFASDQCGQWLVLWYFSAAAAPDLAAEAEYNGWFQIYSRQLDVIVGHVPAVRESLTRHHDLCALQFAIQRRLNDAGTLERLWVALASHTAFALQKLGLKGIGARLYSTAFYPRGTVGHGVGG
ncbi:MAG: hypothetical protein ABL971_05230 [Vicinamibacterales bacterium]